MLEACALDLAIDCDVLISVMRLWKKIRVDNTLACLRYVVRLDLWKSI